jgi:hypothetical protein
MKAGDEATTEEDPGSPERRGGSRTVTSPCGEAAEVEDLFGTDERPGGHRLVGSGHGGSLGRKCHASGSDLKMAKIN